jgi:uncharacterized glyoxalase superfamily protein PhnB
MRNDVALLTVVALTLLAASVIAQDDKTTPPAPAPAAEFGEFTGEILPVFYVLDVREAVAFYRRLGFRFNHFYDHHGGGSVTEWTFDDAPLYAEVASGDHLFALHKAADPDALAVNGMRHYFGVTDVDRHREQVVGTGIEAGEMIDRPWMRMFSVHDPDGHELFFFTRPEE